MLEMSVRRACLPIIAFLVVPSWASAADAPVDEIVVTGERIARSTRETGSSVYVATAADLAAQGGANRLEDVLALVPNLQLGAGESAPTIRGNNGTGVLSSADAFLGGSRPRATLSVDGRALSFNEFIYGLTPIWDVARVEVFRGPQTTTQGRNAIAGAIFVETNNPTPAFEAAARAQFADYDTKQGSVVLSGPIAGEQLQARVAVDYRTGSSFVRRLNPPTDTGADPDREEQFVVRGKLAFRPSALPWATARLTYAHVESTTPQADAVRGSLRRLEYDANNAAQFRLDTDSVILDLDAELGGGFVLTNRLTYADVDVRRLTSPGDGVGKIRTEERSIESILRYGKLADRLSGIVGLYLFDADQREASDFSSFLGLGRFEDKQTSRGVFGEVSWRPLDRLTLTAGGRHQRDHQDRVGALGPFAVDYSRTFEAFLPKFSAAYELSPRATVGVVAARGFNPGGTTVSFLTGQQDDFDAEKLWNYELFVRGQSADGRLDVSANLFVTDYEAAQRPVLTVIGEDIATAFVNAEDARAYGLEVEARWTISDRLSLRAGLGLLDTEIRRFTAAAEPIVGNNFQRAPGVTASGAVSWTPIAKASLDLQARYGDGYQSDDSDTPELRVGSRFVADAQASYQLGPVRAFVYVRNLTDARYWQELYGPAFGTPGEPRRVGGGVEARF